MIVLVFMIYLYCFKIFDSLTYQEKVQVSDLEPGNPGKLLC